MSRGLRSFTRQELNKPVPDHMQTALLRKVAQNRKKVADEILSRWPQEADFLDSCYHRISCISFILGAPRSGTSVIKDTLVKNRGLYSMHGEHRFIFTLNELTWPYHGG